ncbi:hypothetical protein C9374_009129 [Naegleria lovaniensis]|uniref:Guanylate cyclase domain-containing protein n=1 Tax=Naegleria lovaniensis TaxID=51637 RepID=A0AA88GFK3_NAELO|nr:uncharacterized protein C9374_009129 [Naegleria lovaniensis]KAG2377613.1 hypothetical protein C9374_009129 [Naegleria lovaniensis]
MVSKVQPVVGEATTTLAEQESQHHHKSTLSKQQQHEIFSTSGDSYEELSDQPKKQRPFVLRALLSVRLFLIVVITSVVIMTAISIWVAAFVVNEQTAMEQVNVIISNMNEKIASFMNSQLLPAKLVSKQMVADYHNSKIDLEPSIQPYLFSKVKLFGVTNTNLCLGEKGNNILYAYSMNADNSLVYGVKLQQGTTLTIYKANNETGVVNFNAVALNVTYFVDKTDYYQESLRIFRDFSEEGGFGDVYKVIGGGPQSTFWSTPVYNRTELANGNKTRVGIAKVNVSLVYIAQFLKTVKVLERGYVIISEFSNNYVIGSSLNIPGIDDKRIKATDITTRDAGSVMTKFLSTNANSLEPVITSIESNGTKYLVSSTPYVLSNLKWRMTLVFEENEIKKGIITSSFVILGVTLGVTTLGVLISVTIGWIVTNPFINLQEDFRKIEVLDLSNIKERSALFSEAKSIYSSLNETVRWLSEFKAFLPDSVLNQLENAKLQAQDVHVGQVMATAKDTKKEKQNALEKGEEHSSVNSSSHKMESSLGTAYNMKPSKDLFKLGLSPKDLVSLVHVTIPNLNEANYSFESLSSIISKCLVSVSTICKTCRADLQIRSYDEFMIVFHDKTPCVTALETCLKLKVVLDSLNDYLAKEAMTPLQVCMGVASGACVLGNVGNKQMRYFAQVGEIVARAKNLTVLGALGNVSLIVDKHTFKQTKDVFVFRPVDRIMNSSKNTIESVYQCIRKSEVSNDEWMYELEHKTQNTKHEAFANHFAKLFNDENQELPPQEVNEVKEYLLNACQLSPTDPVLQKISKLIGISSQQQLSTYYSQVSTSVLNYVQGKAVKLE